MQLGFSPRQQTSGSWTSIVQLSICKTDLVAAHMSTVHPSQMQFCSMKWCVVLVILFASLWYSSGGGVAEGGEFLYLQPLQGCPSRLPVGAARGGKLVSTLSNPPLRATPRPGNGDIPTPSRVSWNEIQMARKAPRETTRGTLTVNSSMTSCSSKTSSHVPRWRLTGGVCALCTQ
jgi:hypothetical protein